ncbi:Acetyltransferase (GNAT) family protein [compost metagenome]
MVNDIVIKLVDIDNIDVLQEFVKNIGNSVKSFRYFSTRPLTVISNHLVTIVALNNNTPVGYGHLDKEGNVIWLGIAVSENNKGKGIGKLIMNYLIYFADAQIINEICLSVDTENTVAIGMYKKYDFQEFKKLENNNAILMKRHKR